MSLKLFHILIAIMAVLLLTVAIAINPKFWRYNGNYYDIVDKAWTADVAKLKDLPSSCEATSQYRYDEKRQGLAPSSAKPKAKVQIVEHLFPFNVDIHGASKSSPTVDDSGVYLGSDTGWFWKMDHEGKKLWSFYVPGSNNGIHASAAIDDKKVYIATYNGFIYALDKEDGSLVWANPVGQYVGASPLLAGGALYISAETGHPDGILVKLDCNSGETQWASKWLGGHSHSSPAYDQKNKALLVGANSGRFFAFNEENGHTLWQEQFQGQIKGTPMIWDGTAYFGSWDKNYHAYDIKTGEKRWTKYMGGRIQTSLTYVPDSNIGVTNTKVGEIIGISLTDGEILWRLRHGDRNHQFSILVTEDPERPGEYLAWSRCKEFQLCTLDAKTGKLLNNIDLPGSFTSVPFAWKNRIYISLDRNQGLIILE
jgi:outer membrane protein assembly factor BamB